MKLAGLGHLIQVYPLVLFSISSYAAPNAGFLNVLGPQGVNLWMLEKARPLDTSIQHGARMFLAQDSSKLVDQDGSTDFPEQWFQQPLDHFSELSSHTFQQRYWVNKRHYKPGGGGPVIVLDGGETSGEDRIPYLDTGIVEILAKATGGLGVVLEHRYYGESIPVDNFTTDSLRWLSNEQAAADSANFMANVKFEGIDEDLTAPNTPWIYYGGSYAGARAAHMKILYPDLVYGSIASSAVTHAAITNWQYMEIIRQAADPKCSSHLENSIKQIDFILDHKLFSHPLKALFGLAGLKHDVDFVSVVQGPLGSWQSKNWDPAVGSTRFDEFCTALSAPFGNFSAAAELPFNHPERMVPVTTGFSVDFSIINYANYVKKNTVSHCPSSSTVEDCFGTFDDARYQETTLDQDWRLWQFQVCTQWGYFTTAPPDPNHPRIISKRLDLAYESKICKQAFLPGNDFTVPALPNITAVNALGDFAIAADRLAFIDGEVDPWRPDTPHSDDAKGREDTIIRPFKLIPQAVHHWDENGLANSSQEPADIQKIHGETIEFVTEWLKDFKKPGKE
ncbi:serine carboxypeptidase S28-domain-containing protein [Collybia nuda]|uniref:Serine carboxypeptidase S28-domain-containing protein n=1 Tax=Collybia nuda TaxID=64659 RepID=A0A9P5Y894_9AGAR|nr:serine carboxypeptidase S28-domain-containing protein [Collybia nuda]